VNRPIPKAAPGGPPPYAMIEDTAALRDLVRLLGRCPVVALDTESNSLHHYRECVSLIQVTGREADGTLHHAIIDPLTDVEVPLLAPLLADPRVTTVFHGADYDVVSLKRDYGFAIRGIYDTMIAARAAGVPRFGLADLVSGYFGVTLNKKFQKHDWAGRPLSREALDYAHLDTRYLPEIMDRLTARVKERGREDMVAEECALIEQREWVRKEPDPNAYLQLRGAPRLPERDQKVLRELYDLREELARKRDWPPFKIMGTETLIKLAQAAPADARALEAVLGRGNRILRRYGPRILDAVAEGLVSTREIPPKKRGEGRRVTREDEVLLRQLKVWRNDLAESEGLEPSMVVNNQVLQEVCTLRPRDRADLEKIPVIRRWQLRRYSDALLGAVERFEAAGGGR
jgi:ribonuclease D